MSVLSEGQQTETQPTETQTTQGGTGDGQQQTPQTPPLGGTGEGQQQTPPQTPPQGGAGEGQPQTPEPWLPEAYRNDPAFGKFKTLEDLCKSQKHLQSLVGKKTVARPDENSTEEEWAEWYRDNGVPDDPKEYDLAVDQGMPAAWNSDGILDIYRNAFKEAHISGDAAKILWKFRNENLKTQAAQQAAELKSRQEAQVAKFKQEWGDNYAANMNKAFAAFGKLFPGVDVNTCRLCDDPDFIRGMLRAYDAVKDDTMPNQGGATVASALSTVEDRISSILNNPAYQNAQNPDHARLVAEMIELQRKKAQLKASIK